MSTQGLSLFILKEEFFVGLWCWSIVTYDYNKIKGILGAMKKCSTWNKNGNSGNIAESG